jgi:hypothetical protein
VPLLLSRAGPATVGESATRLPLVTVQLEPHARLAVDHFHLVMLANKAVTAVRQRVTREALGRRGRATDPAWANRRLLLRARERLSDRALARMWNGCIDHDPSGQILATWITNARTEGTNRLVKAVKRAACGFRNRNNYRRRVRLHCTPRTRRASARNTTAPAEDRRAVMIGTGAIVDPALGLLLAAGQVPAEAPEGFAAVVTLRDAGVRRARRVLLTVGFAVPVLVGAALGYLALRSAPEVAHPVRARTDGRCAHLGCDRGDDPGGARRR